MASHRQCKNSYHDGERATERLLPPPDHPGRTSNSQLAICLAGSTRIVSGSHPAGIDVDIHCVGNKNHSDLGGTSTANLTFIVRSRKFCLPDIGMVWRLQILITAVNASQAAHRFYRVLSILTGHGGIALPLHQAETRKGDTRSFSIFYAFA